MREIPRSRDLDLSLALAREGYPCLRSRCRALGSDLFRTRMLLRPAICMTGPEAARLFYGSDQLQRRGALPMAVQKTLLGRGGIQGTDGEIHRQRKALFLALLTGDRVDELTAGFRRHWIERLALAAPDDELVLHRATQEVLCRTVCDWAGVPVPAQELPLRTSQLAALIEGAGSPGGPRHWRGRHARRRAERWIAGEIRHARRDPGAVAEGSALRVFAQYREPDGRLLPERIAAVELLNVLRPTVAIARYVVFCALALHQHAQSRERIAAGDEALLASFVQEVRRCYPFFPATSAKARQDILWQGYRIPGGSLVMLDIYGTNLDPRSFEQPETFRPERFLEREPGPFELIPQGGGEHAQSHRCPGEWVTLAIMREASRLLCRTLAYRIPEQDLRIDLRRIPAIPASGLVLSELRSAA